MNKELSTKLQRLRGLLKARSLQGVLLSTRANFSWLTGGRTNHIRSDVEKGVASLWVTPKAVELWCNSIEEKRFQEEEAKGLPFTYRFIPGTKHLIFSLKRPFRTMGPLDCPLLKKTPRNCAGPCCRRKSFVTGK